MNKDSSPNTWPGPMIDERFAAVGRQCRDLDPPGLDQIEVRAGISLSEHGVAAIVGLSDEGPGPGQRLAVALGER